MGIRFGLVGVVGFALATQGCGSSSGGSASSSGGRHVTWLEDGVARRAIVNFGVRSSSGTTDSLELIGTTSDVGVAIAVSAAAPHAPQTFVCGQTTGTVSVTYTDADGGMDLADRSCTVTLSQVGKAGGLPAIGTFEAVIGTPAGRTLNITNGSFEVPINP